MANNKVVVAIQIQTIRWMKQTRLKKYASQGKFNDEMGHKYGKAKTENRAILTCLNQMDGFVSIEINTKH